MRVIAGMLRLARHVARGNDLDASLLHQGSHHSNMNDPDEELVVFNRSPAAAVEPVVFNRGSTAAVAVEPPVFNRGSTAVASSEPGRAMSHASSATTAATTNPQYTALPHSRSAQHPPDAIAGHIVPQITVGNPRLHGDATAMDGNAHRLEVLL